MAYHRQTRGLSLRSPDLTALHLTDSPCPPGERARQILRSSSVVTLKRLTLPIRSFPYNLTQKDEPSAVMARTQCL